MNNRFRLITVALLAASLLGLSCNGGNDGFLDNSDCDYIIAAGLASGGTAQILTDRQCNSYLACDWEVEIDFAAPQGGAGQPPDPNARSQFFLSHYDVTYHNDSTGGSTPGVDVPYPIRVPVSVVADPDSTVSLQGWPVILPGQKAVAPLNDAGFYANGGVVMTAYLTWWGYPITNPDAKCFFVMPWPGFTIYDSGPLPTDPDDLEAFQDNCF